jgi:hypothetical protein
MSQYTQTGIDHATAEALTAAQVRAMPYAGIAALCGVSLGANGESPADFFYVAEAAGIAAALDLVAAQAAWDKTELAFHAAGLTVAQIAGAIGQRPGGGQ